MEKVSSLAACIAKMQLLTIVEVRELRVVWKEVEEFALQRRDFFGLQLVFLFWLRGISAAAYNR
jgi:hypothetical protein